MTSLLLGHHFEGSITDFGFKESSDFDAFKSVATTATAASTNFSDSVEQSMASSEKKKKKKKKDKDKEKKSSSSRKSSSGSKSKKKSLTDDSTPSGDVSKQLFAKMITDAYGDDFGDFGDEDPFETVRFEDEDWGSESRESKSTSSNGKSRASSHTGMNTCSTGEVVVASSVDSAGARTTQSKTKMVLDMNVENMFAEQQNNQDILKGNDDDSVISELTGLTGVFQGIPQYDPDEEKEDDKEDPDLPKIMKQLLQEHPPPEYRESTMIKGQSSRRIMKSCLAAHCRPPKRVSSIVTTASRSSVGTKRVIQKTQKFSTVSIRLYDRILTENPSTIQGPSIGIGWRFLQKPTMDLNAYESERGEPIPSNQLVLTREQREAILTAQGVSAAEIAAGIRNNNKARQQRRQTVQNLKAFKVEEALEGAVKKIWNPFGGKSKK